MGICRLLSGTMLDCIEDVVTRYYVGLYSMHMVVFAFSIAIEISFVMVAGYVFD